MIPGNSSSMGKGGRPDGRISEGAVARGVGGESGETDIGSGTSIAKSGARYSRRSIRSTTTWLGEAQDGPVSA